jgi:hypothetical protein
MRLAEKLDNFNGAVSIAATDAPDRYPDWRSTDYVRNKADILNLWSEIKPLLKRDLDKAAYVTQRLDEGFAALDAGNKEDGQQAMWDIYNLHPKKLR